MTAPAPVGLLRRLVARAMTAGPAAPGPDHPRPESGNGRDASATPLLRSTAESHLSWFAARAAAASRLHSARTSRPADPPGFPAWPDAEHGRPADPQTWAAPSGPRPEAGERPVPTGLDASGSEAPAPLKPYPRTARPPAAERRVSLGPVRAEHRTPAARPDGPEQSVAGPPEAAPAHPAPRRRTPGAGLGPVAGPAREPGLRAQDPDHAARPDGPGPLPVSRTADNAAAAPTLPPAVVLRPRPGDPAHGAPAPSTPGRATRRGRSTETPAPAPVVVRIGRVELVVTPAAAEPVPAAPPAPAAGRHPDLLAAHRRHGGGWPG
ncbi:hypothetical protein [Kitasatospora sp. NPDC097691]|uniref:hypothetical protein n=1 Tax=Kitasatospora sp. NPDC097691 TaxID=3157231 RepID=UPI00331BB0E5